MVVGAPVKTHASRGVVQRHLGSVRLVQEFSAHDGAVWAAAFARDGRLLATGGQDGIVRVWAVNLPAAKWVVGC